MCKTRHFFGTKYKIDMNGIRRETESEKKSKKILHFMFVWSILSFAAFQKLAAVSRDILTLNKTRRK